MAVTIRLVFVTRATPEGTTADWRHTARSTAVQCCISNYQKREFPGVGRLTATLLARNLTEDLCAVLFILLRMLVKLPIIICKWRTITLHRPH